MLSISQVYVWFEDTGNPFLSSSNTIGRSENESSYLIRGHDSFAASSSDTYALADRLRSLTTELASKKECEAAEMKKEEEALKGVVDGFSSRMSARRDIIVNAEGYFRKLSEVCLIWQIIIHSPIDQSMGQSTSHFHGDVCCGTLDVFRNIYLS